MSTLTEYLGLGVFAEDQPARWESEYVVEVPAGQDDLSNYVILNLWNSGNNLADYGYMSSQGFTTNYNGWYIDDTDIFDFGAEDFTVRLQFGFGSYYAYNELEGQSTIPVLCMGPGQVYDSPFLVAMVNPGTPNYVQQGDLFFSLKDTNDNEAYCYLDVSDWYLPTYASKFHMEISRRGSLFSLRYNGLYGQKEVNNTFVSFGSLDISGMTRSYIMSSSITGSVNNGFYGLQITKGISRTVGHNCLGKYAKTFAYPNQPMIKRRHSEDLMCKNLVVPVLGLRAMPPVLSVVDDTGECVKDETASGNVLTNDSGEYLRVTKVSGSVNNVGVEVAGSAGGVFTIDARGEWTFDPDGDFDDLTGEDEETTSVTYHVSDGITEDESSLTITVSAAIEYWTPAELSAIVFDALDTDSITLNGSNVSSWSDMFDVGVTASQGTSSAQPVMGTGLVTFDGGDSLSISGSASASWCKAIHYTGGTIVVLAKFGNSDNPTTNYILCGTNGTAGGKAGFAFGYEDRTSYCATTSDALYFSITNGTGHIASWYTGTGGCAMNFNGILDSNTDKIIAGRFRPKYTTTSQRFLANINGGADVTGSLNSQTTSSSANAGYDFQIGTTNGVGNLVGEIKSLCVVPSILSDADVRKLEGWMAHRHSVTDLLPSGHPYKTTAPTV